MNSSHVYKQGDIPEDSRTELTEVVIQGVPLALYALWVKTLPYWYKPDGSWRRARTYLNYMGASMLLPFGQTLHNDFQALYNQLDAANFAQNRTYTGTGTAADPFVYTPPIPQVREYVSYPGADNPYGVAGNTALTATYLFTTFKLIWDLLKGTNAFGFNGDTVSVTYEVRQVYAKLDEILTAIGEGDGPSAEQIAEIIALLGV